MTKRILTTLIFIVTLVMNYLSTSWSLWWGMEDLAGLFPFPVMPAGAIFGIVWWVIYLTLLIWIIRMWVKWSTGVDDRFLQFFWWSSVGNIWWIVATAMESYTLAAVALLFLMVILWTMMGDIKKHYHNNVWVWFPFGVYGGWITLATTVLAPSQILYLAMPGIALSLWWSVMIAGVGLVMSIIAGVRYRNVAQWWVVLVWLTWVVVSVMQYFG